jgi:hypothetical protein
MRSLTIRVSIALLTFTIGITAAAVWSIDLHKSEKRDTPKPQPQPQDRSQEILRLLVPDGVWADVTQLDRFDRADEIRVLEEAQVEARDERAVSIAFLLAVLDHEYVANRKQLLDALQACASERYPHEAECDYFVADYLMELCRRGDFFLLGPLFDVNRKADGAFSESLWGLYSDMLYEHPDRFLKTLSLYPKNKQRDLCAAAAVEDGGGMAEDRFRTIHESLLNMSDTSLRPVARTCAIGLEHGYERACLDRQQNR